MKDLLQMKRVSVFLLSISLLGICPLKTSLAQTTAQEESRLIKKTEKVTITFHRASLKDGHTQREDGRILTGPSLSANELAAGFKVGEVVVLRVKSTYPYFIYIVNASEWDGTTLQYPSEEEENEKHRANQTEEIAFRLTNKKKKQITGNEELLVMVTKTKIESNKLSLILSQKGDDKGKIEVEKSWIPEWVTPQRVETVIKISCALASFYYRFAGLICKASGYGAAEIERVRPDSGDVRIAPVEDSEKLFFRISFAIKP